MNAQEVKEILSKNRDMYINYFNDNCRVYKHYTLKWFMERCLEQAEYSWARRKNIGEKELNYIIKSVMKTYPFLAKNYVSNWQKAVNYFGEERALQILNAR